MRDQKWKFIFHLIWTLYQIALVILKGTKLCNVYKLLILTLAGEILSYDLFDDLEQIYFALILLAVITRNYQFIFWVENHGKKRVSRIEAGTY